MMSGTNFNMDDIMEEETIEFKEAVYDWLKIRYSALVNMLLDKIERVIRQIKQILENNEDEILSNYLSLLEDLKNKYRQRYDDISDGYTGMTTVELFSEMQDAFHAAEREYHLEKIDCYERFLSDMNAEGD